MLLLLVTLIEVLVDFSVASEAVFRFCPSLIIFLSWLMADGGGRNLSLEDLMVKLLLEPFCPADLEMSEKS